MEKSEEVQVEENQDEIVLEEESEELDPLAEAQKEAEDYKDRWLRLAAEFDNYKKRTAREFDALVQSANENLLRDLLPVLDSVARALDHSEEVDADSDGFKEGMKMIMEQFPKVLHNRGLSEVEAIGEAFDPNYHEALMQMPSEQYDEGVVAEVVERGYLLANKVLRPAKVVVSQGRSEAETAGKKEQ